MIRVMHIITDLDTGGAEMMLCKLVCAMDRKQFQNRVISLQPPGAVGQRIREIGVPVDSLYLNPACPNPLAFLRAIHVMREWRPHVVQTWMYHADLFGMITWAAAGRGALLWNIRCTHVDFSKYRRSTRWVMKGCAEFSRAPHAVIANSRVAIEDHRKMGYHPKRWVVIPNGFNLQHFRPDTAMRSQIRKELEIPEVAPVVGLVARFDPMKDHAAFFSAAKIVAAGRPDTHFVLCGEGVNRDNPKLRTLLRDLGSVLNIHMLGRRDDINRIMVGLDILVSASVYGESFPNVIAEAMACGVPCVVTDVGYSAKLIENTGQVVPRRNPPAMAHAVLDFINLDVDKRHALGRSAREKIENHYSIENIVAEYEELYLAVASKGVNRG